MLATLGKNNLQLLMVIYFKSIKTHDHTLNLPIFKENHSLFVSLEPKKFCAVRNTFSLHCIGWKWSCLFGKCLLGCPKFFSPRIEPLFLYGMCIGRTRSHAKFQTSGLNNLAWPPLFVHGSWPSRKSFKMTWKSYFRPCHLKGHQKCSPKWYNT